MMKSKKAIVNQFRVNEAFVSSLGSLTSTIKKGRYRVLNNSGQYETIHLETSANQVIENSNKQFVSDIEKDRWNNKADKFGNTSQDFSAKNLNVSSSILPTQNGIDIGSPEKRFRGIYVDEAYLSTNTLYIGDTPILGTNNDTITIKADPDQSITMQTRATGTTKVISEAGVELSTAGMNANVVLQAKGSNAQVNIASTSSTNIDASNVKITGDTLFKNSIIAEKDLTVSGNLTVTGANTTLSTSNLIIKDNIIEINNGQTGSSVSEGKAGIKINRGDADAFNIVFDESDDCLKVGADSSLKTVALQEWVDSTTAKRNHTHDYLSLTGGNLTGQLTINKHKVYHAGDKPSLEELGAAANDHTHTSGNITALHGYTKLNSTSDIVASDSLNTALGKLEKGLEGKKDISWVPDWEQITNVPTTFKPTTHSHESKEVKKMTGYVKGTTTSAITASDSLNAAIAKLEVALDKKEATHSHPYRHDTWVPSWNQVTSKPNFAEVATSGSYSDLKDTPNIITIKDTSTTDINATWSAKKINTSLAGKAASTHKHSSSDITGLGSAATLNAGTAANEVLKLDSTGKVPISNLPSIAINQTFTAADQAAALKLTVEVGDIVIVTADAKTYICVDYTKTVFDDKFKALSSGTDSITKTEVETLLNDKVDKIPGKKLSTNDFTNELQTKLNGIDAGANKYIHPNDINTRHVTDAQIKTWDNKANASHTHTSAQISDATSVNTANTVVKRSANGLIEVSSLNLGNNEVRQGGGDNTALVMAATGGNVYLRPDKNDTSKELVVSTNTITFNGNKVYHVGNKPSPDEIGAAAKSHNHTSLSSVTKIAGAGASGPWGSIDIGGSKASWAGFNFSDMGYSFLVNKDGYTGVWKNGGNAVFAFNESGALANGTVGWDKITGKPSTLPPSAPHANSISGSNNTGVSTANDANKIWKSGFYETSNGTNYPSSGSWYWLIHAGHTSNNSGGNYQYGMQITAQNGTNNFYIRTTNNVGVGTWNKLYHTGNKPTLTELGITTLTKGSYLTGSNYNGTAATTWSVDATTTATANKVVARDTNADVSARSFKSNLPVQNDISGSIAFRVNNSDNDYIRFCSDTGAIRTFLNTYAKNETYNRNEMDNRYRQKTDLVFTDTISIITPAA